MYRKRVLPPKGANFFYHPLSSTPEHPKLLHPSKKAGKPLMNVVTYRYKFLFMKRIVVVIILIAFIGAVAFASLSRTNRTQKEKAPVKQEQKDEKKESKRHCIFY